MSFDKWWEENTNNKTFDDECEYYTARSYSKDAYEHLSKKMERLEKAICIYVRAELGNMNFENDQEAIDYFLDFADKAD